MCTLESNVKNPIDSTLVNFKFTHIKMGASVIKHSEIVVLLGNSRTRYRPVRIDSKFG